MNDALKRAHNQEVLRLARIIRLNARLAGIELDQVSSAGLVRNVLDNYKPVGVWRTQEEQPTGDRLGWARPGVWKILDIWIGSRMFSYKFFANAEYKGDEGFQAHAKRKVMIEIGRSISAWILGQPEPNTPNERGDGTTSEQVGRIE